MKWIVSILCLLSISAAAQTDAPRTVTMKEYVDANIEWSQKYNAAQLAALKEANELVRLSLQEYKLVNNEWREQMKDQTGTYVTRTELILAVSTILSLFWGWNRNQREKKQAEGNDKIVHSGDKAEVKK